MSHSEYCIIEVNLTKNMAKITFTYSSCSRIAKFTSHGCHKYIVSVTCFKISNNFLKINIFFINL